MNKCRYFPGLERIEGAIDPEAPLATRIFFYGCTGTTDTLPVI